MLFPIHHSELAPELGAKAIALGLTSANGIITMNIETSLDEYGKAWRAGIITESEYDDYALNSDWYDEGIRIASERIAAL